MRTSRTYLILAFTVAVSVLAATTARSDTGFGCWVEKARLQADWRASCEAMKAAGMSTMAFYPTSDDDLVQQVETALEVGLVSSASPIILVSNMAPRPGVVGNEAEWADMPARVDAARARATHGDQWPEIVLYGTDEPSSAEQVKSWSESYHAGGYRCTTALCVPNIRDFIPYLDILIVHASPGVLTPENVCAIRAAGKEFAVYNVQLRCASPDLMRYWAGLWTWQAKPLWNLMWEWAWFAQDGERGPANSAGLVGYRQGVDDYRALRAIDNLRRPPDWDFWPGICTTNREAWNADFNGTAATLPIPNPAVALLRGGVTP